MIPFLNYLFVLLLSYAGLYVGVLLGVVAREELRVKKYYELLKFFLYLVIAFYFLLEFLASAWMIALILAILGVTLLYANLRDYWLYPLLSVLFYLSTQQLSLFFAQSILIFLLGLPLGTLEVKEAHTKPNYKKFFSDLTVRYVWYVVIGLALYLVF